jgi:nicotinate-nucleotide--dimethylbenzimidazole phosphoribosyltransferase
LTGALDGAPQDTNALDNAARGSAARSDDRLDDAAPSTPNGGRRTRRPTNGGTAFATAVHVEDTAPVQVTTAPVVTTEPDPQPEPAGFTSVVTGPSGDQAAPEDSPPPVRRTRAGSAVARVTVVSDPAPVPVPEPDLPAAEALPEILAEPEALVADPEAIPESDTVAEPETTPEPIAAPAEPEATLTTFVTYESEPLASEEAEAPVAPGTPAAPQDPADAPTPDALAVTQEPANPVIAEDPAPAASPEAPVASEPEQWQEQTAVEEHPEAQ